MNSKPVAILAAYLHVIGVATYLGGALVMEYVLTPAQKFIPPAQAMVVGRKAADRYLVMVWSALTLILISGLLRLWSIRREDWLITSRLWETQYGRTLLAMLILWTVLVINGAIMTFVLRPKLADRAQAQTGAAQMASRQQSMAGAASWVNRISRIDLVIAFFVALLGASLGFGGIL